MSDSTPQFVILVPELFRRTGGVQVFSRNFVAAMDVIAGRKIPVISMNDREKDFPSEFGDEREVVACGEVEGLQRKWLFVRAVWKRRSSTRFLCTHPNFCSLLGLLKKSFRLDYLTVAHGVDVWNVGSRRMISGLRKASMILPVSRFTQSKLVEQLVEPLPPMIVFPNMVDETTFFPATPLVNWRERLEISSTAHIVLTVARLDRTEARKGYDLVLEAMTELIREQSDLFWILAGKGEDAGRIADRAEELGLRHACRFTGFVSDEELPDLYRSADSFILPSQKEGFGIVFLEAAACGLPVVAGNLDGSFDALDSGRLGQLIDPNSVEMITAALRRIICEDASVPFIGEEGKLSGAVSEKFGRLAFQARVHQVLQQLKWV